MRALLAGVRSVVRPALDLLYALVGLVAPLYLTLGVANGLVGTPVPAGAVGAFAFGLAIGLSYPFVVRTWSLGWLGSYLCWFVAGLLGVGLLGAAVVIGAGVDLAGSDPRPQALLVVLAHVVAVAAVSVSDARLWLRAPPRSGRARASR